MSIIRETSVVNIKNKMTEIRRNRNGKSIYHNYFNNCDNDEEIFALYGESTVVFWDNDQGVERVYFYSSDEEELTSLLKQVPTGCIIDYVTRNKDERIRRVIEQGNWQFLHEMHRMVMGKKTEEEQRDLEEKKRAMYEVLWRPNNVRCAEIQDVDYLYKKLYEVFDERESHLPAKEELRTFIKNRWVSVYAVEGEIKGFQIFKVEKGQFYGYQIWNDVGPEGYFSLNEMTNKLYGKYLEKHKVEIEREHIKPKPSYCWVNVNNKKNMRLVKFWGQKFDGLYDFVYEKL